MLKSTDKDKIEETLESSLNDKDNVSTKSLEEALDNVMVPLDLADEIDSHGLQGDVDLGLSDQDLNSMIEYMSGSVAAPPKSLEAFSPSRLKNFTTLATISQVSRVPGLIKLLNETNGLLFASPELHKMDMNDLTKLSKSLSEEIRLILDGARKTLDTLDKLDSPVSANQQLLDQLLQMPDSEIIAMKEYLNERNKRD